MRGERPMWAVATLCALAVAIACALWIRANPLPSYYDEALYAIYARIDVSVLRTYGLFGAWLAMLNVDPYVPPAMRMLALPVTAIASPSLALLRALSLAGFFAAAAIGAVAVRRVAGTAASAIAFTLVIALPILVLATRMFGTEPPLLIAVALLLLALTSRRAALWIALSVALGLLAKTSYAVIAAPMLITAAIAMKGRRRAILIGTPIGIAIALTWWSHDPMKAIRFGIQSGNFVRHATSFGRWCQDLLRCDFGLAVAAAIALVFVIALVRGALHPFAAVCLAGALPLLAMHATSINHNPRLIAVPAMLIAIAAASLTSTLTLRANYCILALAVVQIALMVVPWQRDDRSSYIWRGVTEVMAPAEQWDWTPLARFAQARGWAPPRIAILGDGYAFNPPQIRYAWPNGAVPVEELYDWTAGKPFVLQQAVARAAQAQLVVTAPGYHGEASDGQPPNNRYNDIFAAALAHDPRFQGPFLMNLGLHHPAVVQVFVRRGA